MKGRICWIFISQAAKGRLVCLNRLYGQNGNMVKKPTRSKIAVSG